MYPYALLAGLLLLFAYLTSANIDLALAQREDAQQQHMAGQLKAYGSFVAAYAQANPSASGAVADAAAGVPAWLTRPAGMQNRVQSGRAYIFWSASSEAEAFAIARECGFGLTCGVTRSGSIVLPGEATPLSVALPGGIPASGAVVLIL